MADAFNPQSGHIDQALTNLVVKQPMQVRLIADDVCNLTHVKHATDTYYKIGDAHLMDTRGLDDKAPGAESKAGEVYWTTDEYACKVKARHAVLPDDTRENADDQLGLEAEHAALPRAQVLLARELRAAALLFASANYSNTAGAAATWDNATTANVKLWNDILTGKLAVQKAATADPTDLSMGASSWTAIAKYIMLQGGTAGGVQWDGVRKLLGENPDAYPRTFMGMKLNIGTAAYHATAKKASSVARSALTFVWSDNALISAKGTPGVKAFQFATYFRMKGYPHVRRGRLPGTAEGDWFEFKNWETEQPKLIQELAGYLITNTES